MTPDTQSAPSTAPRPTFIQPKIARSGIFSGAWFERNMPYWLILPAVIAMGGVLIYPMLFSFWVSFHDWPLTSQSVRWIGIDNYTNIVHSNFFRRVLVQNIVFVLACISANFIIGMALALLLNLPFPGRGLFRTLFLLPMLIPPTLAGFNFSWIFNDRFGLANQLIITFHLGEPRAWLSDPTLARFAIVLVTVWSGVPFFMLILLAGLQSLPESPYEAATIDGARSWQKFRDITLPLMKPVIAVAAAIQVIDLFRVFDTIYVMTNGGPAHSTELLPFYIFRSAFSENRAGYAAALGYITLLITTLFLIPIIRADRKEATR